MASIQFYPLCAFSALVAFIASPFALAQEGDPNKITEREKKVFQDLVNGRNEKNEGRAIVTEAVMNARQIGLALFEFESEYGAFPDEKTAGDVKRATETKAEIKAETANDCFFQLIAAGIAGTDRIFTIGRPVDADKEEKKALAKLEHCGFAYLSGMNAAGNVSRPVVVAPLVNGKTTFDPQLLGGKAVILRVDNSVTTLPIQPDGRVLIDGKDIFDPAQPFWNGKVPPIKWPAK